MHCYIIIISDDVLSVLGFSFSILVFHQGYVLIIYSYVKFEMLTHAVGSQAVHAVI